MLGTAWGCPFFSQCHSAGIGVPGTSSHGKRLSSCIMSSSVCSEYRSPPACGPGQFWPALAMPAVRFPSWADMGTAVGSLASSSRLRTGSLPTRTSDMKTESALDLASARSALASPETWCVLMRVSEESWRAETADVPVTKVYDAPRMWRSFGISACATPKCRSTRTPAFARNISRSISRMDMPDLGVLSVPVSSSSPASPHQATPQCATTCVGVAISSARSIVRSSPDGSIVP
mmetsp:Transcript_12375/g.32344  ORF Transcript_12375/g.32344 Transcript_12375/m.32344 type:complete len:234 (-) Transcript_12375:216-917(-)